MADTIRTKTQLVVAAPNNTTRLISPQLYRDFILSAFGAAFPAAPTPQDDSFNTAGNGFFDTNSCWLNTTPGGKELWLCFDGPHNAADWRLIWPVPATGVLTITAGTNITLGGTSQNPIINATAPASVTSVGLSMPAEFSVAGSPVTSSGTLAVTKANQNVNLVYAGPSTGSPAAPTFRMLVAADLPATIPASQIGTGYPVNYLTPGTWDAGVGFPWAQVTGAPSFATPEGPTGFMFAGTSPTKRWYPIGWFRSFPSTACTRTGFTAGQVWAIPRTFANDTPIAEIGIELNGTIGERKSAAIYESAVSAIGNLYPTNLIQDLGEVTVAANGIQTIKWTTGVPFTPVAGKVYWFAYRQAENAAFGTMSIQAQYLYPLLGVEEVGGAVLGTSLPCVGWTVATTYASTWPSTFPAGAVSFTGDTNVVPALIARH